MFKIDRSLIVVKPKQPFLDWVQSVDYAEGLTLKCIREDSSAYLSPQPLDNSELSAILEWCYEVLFEAELESWYTDLAVWPQERNMTMFLEWFDVEFHSLVFDLVDAPIQVIEYGPDDPNPTGSNGN